MQYRKIFSNAGLSTYALIFDEGDEAVAELSRFAGETGVNGASLSGVGAASSATLGWFDFAAKSYEPNRIGEQVEVVSILGDIATTEGRQTASSRHAVVAKRGGSAFGGHLLECT